MTVRITINLHQDIVDTLKRLAEEKGITMTEVFQRVLAEEAEKAVRDANREQP